MKSQEGRHSQDVLVAAVTGGLKAQGQKEIQNGQNKHDFIYVGIFLVYGKLLSKTSGRFLKPTRPCVKPSTPHQWLLLVYSI